jgi:hypothetical protein
MASKIRMGTMSLGQLRELIAATTAEIDAIAMAPLPFAEAEANLAAALDQLASLYTPDALLAEFSRDVAPTIGTVQMLLGDPRFDVQNFHAFLAGAFGDTLLALWRPRVRLLYEHTPELAAAAVPVQERAARVAALRQTLRDLEVQEELAICSAAARGEQIDRRADCDPAVLFAPEVLAAEAGSAPA